MRQPLPKLRLPRYMLLILLTGFCLSGFAQSWMYGKKNNPENSRKFSELTIPSSPAFDLMQVNAAYINKPNIIRDFKVDWSFKSYKLSPNLALQGQPIWEMFYSRDNLYKYQQANGFLKTLSTFDVSVGTVEDEWSNRKLAYAFKLNLYRQYDPWASNDEIDNTLEAYYNERYTLDSIIYIKSLYLDTLESQSNSDPLVKREVKKQIEELEKEVDGLKEHYNTKVKDIVKSTSSAKWNASHVDVAYGRSLSFASITTNSIKQNGQGNAAWINSSIGIGKTFLLSTLIKYNFLVKSVVPTRADTSSISQETIGTGINIRYGNEKVTFFAEYFYEQSAKSNSNLIQNNIVGYGGDWRFSNNVILSFSLRTFYDGRGKLTNMVPFIGLSCMMR